MGGVLRKISHLQKREFLLYIIVVLVLCGIFFWRYSMEGMLITKESERLPEFFPEGFIMIPAGTFEMGDHFNMSSVDHGDGQSDELPTHSVKLGKYALSAFEVTNDQYCAFLNDEIKKGSIERKNGEVFEKISGKKLFIDREVSSFSSVAYKDGEFYVADFRGRHPVINVMWEGAAAYCNYLSEKAGFTALYNLKDGTCTNSASGFRLPTEAEWEYAAYGGDNRGYRLFPWGDSPDISRANWPDSKDPYETGELPYTTPVGFFDGTLKKKADFNWPGNMDTFQTLDGSSGRGLYDMAGNAWEWCHDLYGREFYKSSALENPGGPLTGTLMPDGKSWHTLRGGNWYNGEWGHSRASNRNPAYYRGPQDPNHPFYHVGFRPAFTWKNQLQYTKLEEKENKRPPENNKDQTQAKQTDGGPGGNRGGKVSYELQTDTGLILNTESVSPGYTLFAPKHYTETYLLNNAGEVVKTWNSNYEPGQSAFLLENGHLLRAAFDMEGAKEFGRGIGGGGDGGRVEEFDQNGKLIWEMDYHSSKYFSHHDMKPLPNGNILLIVWDRKTGEEAIEAGRKPDMLPDGELWPDSVVEIKPTYPKGGTVVWEWHVWDHLIQDYDKTKKNYGDVKAHPELIDINYWAETGSPAHANWNHMNSIYYNPDLDQIMLSVRGFSELWVIDHSTTTAEAMTDKGGKYGKGGTLLYRWGNPTAYRAGDNKSQKLFQQHDTQWIEKGLPGEGNILVFNNGPSRPDGSYSTVEEIVPPMDSKGNYLMTNGVFGPDKAKWTYSATPKESFFSGEISGAQRLTNGNTLICSGVHGVFFEIDQSGKTVWKYTNPVTDKPGGMLVMDDRGHPMNAVFKIHRYPVDYPGIKALTLDPGKALPKAVISKDGNSPGNQKPPKDQKGNSGNQNNNGANGPGQKPDRTEGVRVPANTDRYTDNRDGTVTDKQTGLMWQKQEVYNVSLEQAGQAAGKLSAGGYNDWRMPTMLELLSLVDTSLNKPPFHDILGMSDTEYFWSSESKPGVTDRACVLNAGGGTGYKQAKESRAAGGDKIYSLKCVRGKWEIPNPRFTDNGDGSITDHLLRLVWKQESLPEMSLEEAKQQIEKMNEKQPSWRLPTMPELAMLCDRSFSNPAVDPKYFHNLLPGKYWTSSPLAGGRGKQWYVDLTSGMTTYDDPNIKHLVFVVHEK